MKRQDAFRCLLIALAILASLAMTPVAKAIPVPPCTPTGPTFYIFAGTDPTVGFINWAVFSPTCITFTTSFVPLTATSTPAAFDPVSLCPIFEAVIQNPQATSFEVDTVFFSACNGTFAAVFTNVTPGPLIAGNTYILVGSGSGTLTVSSSAPAPVPEPGTLVLVASGLLGAGVLRKRARRP